MDNDKASLSCDLLYLFQRILKIPWKIEFDEVNQIVSKELLGLDKIPENLVLLENPLAYISKKNAQKFYFQPKHYSEIFDVISEHDKSKLTTYQSEISKLVSGCQSELSMIHNSPVLVDRVLKKYFSFVSFSKPFDQRISAYQYAKIHSMFASALRSYKRETKFSTQQLLTEKPFIYLSGDVSGIQKFISNVSTKGALRSYRGRSFFVEFIQEVIVDMLLEASGMSRLNTYFIGGGHFHLVLPNTESVKNSINRAIDEINLWLIKNRLELSVIMDYEPFGLSDLKSFESVLSKLSEKIRRRKLSPYNEEQMKLVFEPFDLMGLEVCGICGRKVKKLYKIRGDEEEPIACNICKLQYNLGKELLDKETVYIVQSDAGEFEIFGKNYDFLSDITSDSVKGYKIRAVNEIKNNEEHIIPLELITYSYKPSLEEIAKESPGKKLASFQADVDNLGKIFRNEITKENFWVSAMISGLLTYFFKVFLSRAVEKRRLSVIYSGGDDLFLLGAWDEVLDFSNALYKSFRKFTGNNENVTFSAGFFLFDEKTGMKTIKNFSEHFEGMAKDNGKDSIAISNAITKEKARNLQSGIALKWGEFEQVYSFFNSVKEIANYLDRSIIRKVLNITYSNTPLAHAYYSYIYAKETDNTQEEFIEQIMSMYGKESFEKVNLKLNFVSQMLDLLVRK